MNEEAGAKWQMKHGIRARWRKFGRRHALLALGLDPKAEGVEQYVEPFLRPVQIIVQPSSQYPQDVGACATSAKGAIDGFVDARVLLGDGEDRVRVLTYLARLPVRDDREVGLRITIVGWE